MIMTSFIDDLSQLNVKQGTAWVVQMLYNVKNYNNDVLLLCTLLRERSRYAMFKFHSTDIVVGINKIGLLS